MRRFFAARKREPDAPPSSASSSSASTDNQQPTTIPLPKRSWKPWTAAKRSLSLKSRSSVPDWSNPPPLPTHQSDDADADDDNDDNDDDAHYNAPSPPPDPRNAVRVLARIVDNAASDTPHVSPFLHIPGVPLYPRSINRCTALPPAPAGTRVSLLRKRLAARLRAADFSPADLAAISPLATRSPPPALPPPSSINDISRLPPTAHILRASPGLRRWISRPCFEDRYVIYVPSDSGLQAHPISSAWAIAALEYPEHLDVMVDPDFDQPPLPNQPHHPPTLEYTLAATPSHASTTDQAVVSASSQARSSYMAIPSPLRNEHPPSATAPPSSTTPEDNKANKANSSNVKRVVRFTEDDSDDGTPLHIVRMKKKRDEKANFLRQEQIRRAREEDIARRQEAQRIQQEALEKERQRLALEQERKEKEKAYYAEQILAARARRELSRAGGSSSNTSSNTLLVPSSSFPSLKDAQRNKPPLSESRRQSRLSHDGPPSISIPRGEASEHLISQPNNRFSDSSSPDSSRPPSLAYSPISPGQGHSRPPSTYSAHTSSSEDVRQQSASNRSSFLPSGPSAYSRPPIIANYSNWSGSNPNLHYAPPVPPFPDFITDMPLLPPTAPFMKHARPRSTSSSRKDSSPGPSSASSRRGSVNSSSERVNLAPNSAGSSSSRNPSSSPRPPQQRHASTPSKPTQERRLSSDSRGTAQTHRTSNTHQSSHTNRQSHYSSSSRPSAVTSRSQPALDRGRPMQPAWPQVQYVPVPMPMNAMNPWMNGMPMTGMPMTMGMPMSAPSGMPYMGMPVYPMVPMMTGGSQNGTPVRNGSTQARRADKKWAPAIS